MFNNEILQKLLISYLYGNDILHFPQELKLIAESTSRLSKLFTRDRDNLPSDYLKDRNLRNAYILYFLQANLYKIHIPLRELSMHPANLFQRDRLRILDIGSGPGTAILGILEFFAGRDQKPFLEFVAVDSVAENLRDAEGLFKLFMKGHENQRDKNVPPILNSSMDRRGVFKSHNADRRGFPTPPACSLVTVKACIEKIKNLPYGSYDIIILSNLLSEVGHNDPERINKRVMVLKKLLNDFMSDNGSCIIIEPALRETSREMLEVRDGMLAEGFHIYSPCLMNKQCPALENPKDWCHEDIPWNPPELIKKIDNLTGLRKDSIKFSYLVIRREKISLADFYGGNSYRIVSEPLISKGKMEFYICGSSGRNLVVRLDKNRSPLNKAFDELKRGDVVLFKGVINEANRLKVSIETDIQVMKRHH